jgi:UDP-2,4-diacetamido-2,4,6-trideoxy-beta-L-altropyranose hydrolase
MAESVAIRVDASPEMGLGHAMRCLTLADALRAEGTSVRFVSRWLPDWLRDSMQRRGHSLMMLDTGSRRPVGDLPHAHWLGTDQLSDAHQTREALAGGTWDWVIVDHYALDQCWERVLRSLARRVLVIDDLADRVHACDVLLDQNHLREGKGRYRGKTPPGCLLLVGPRYALLRPEYRQHRMNLRRRNGSVRRVLVFFGSDELNLTGRALDALSDVRLRHLIVDAVCGSDQIRRAELERAAAKRPGTAIHGPRPHLADLMTQADLALGASGSTTWERMCLGLPSLVITLADNQIPLAGWLAEQRLIGLIGHGPDLGVADIRDALLDEITHQRQAECAAAAMQLSDGLGTSRVVAALLEMLRA